MMKTFRIFFAIALLAISAPTFAQWQTPNHSVPIGKGSGYQGFGAAVPGTAGQPFVSMGPTTDPAFGNIANSGFASGAADTYKGSLNGTSVVDVPRAPCTAANQALRYTAGVGESCGSISVTTGYDMPINLGLSIPSPSGNALVINLTQANGSAPTSNNPVLVPFRSTALTTGTVTWSTISAPLSITIPSGATLGTSSSNVPFRVWIFVEYNGGVPELGVATCSNPTTIFSCAAWEGTLPTSTTIGGSSNSGGVLYATTGVVADAVRIIGYCEYGSGLATAGTWASACTTLQPFGPGIKKPGDVVQTVYATTTTNVNATVQGTKYDFSGWSATPAITPTSTANLVRVRMTGTHIVASGSGYVSMFRGTDATPIGSYSPAHSGNYNPVNCEVLDAPHSTSSVTYGGFIVSTSGTEDQWLATPDSLPTGVGTIIIEEFMSALDTPANDNINPGIFSQTG